MKPTITEICPDVTRACLLLIPENHSRNVCYFESMARLIEISKGAGFEVHIDSLDESLTEPRIYELPSDLKLQIELLERKGN